MSATEHIRIHRMNLPPIPTPNGTLIEDWSTYATVTAGDITADIERFTYWHPSDGGEAAEVVFEVRINGLPEHAGTADILAAQPATLSDLATVCIHAALLLNEARQQAGNRTAPASV